MDKHELKLVCIANRTLTQSKDFTENKKMGKKKKKKKKVRQDVDLTQQDIAS